MLQNTTISKIFLKSYSDVSFEKNEKYMRIDGNPNKQSLLTPILSFCILTIPHHPFPIIVYSTASYVSLKAVHFSPPTFPYLGW